MSTLVVSFKFRDNPYPIQAASVDFFKREVHAMPGPGFGAHWVYLFSHIEWIDFGTTRWYPNNL